jgi:hypothetical protein
MLPASSRRPHHWLYKEPFHAVNEHFQWVEGPVTANVSIDKIALHHYVLKSEEVRGPWPAN